MISQHLFAESGSVVTRRRFFSRVGTGIQGAALLHLLGGDLLAETRSAAAPRQAADLLPRPSHFSAKAKSVIHLFMNGGPSQMDLFDPKPELDRRHGESYFDAIAGEVESPTAAGALMRSPFKFAQHGQSGMWVSDALPHTSQLVDDLALIRSLHTTNITHEPALSIMQTGHMQTGHPAIGSWVTYGLGSECQDLPAYVVLDDPKGLPVNGIENWQAGFLPPLFQGTRVRSIGSPVLNLRAEEGDPPEIVALSRELRARMDEMHKASRPGEPNLDARIASYELAARMQISATDALDLSQESAATIEMYGIGREPTDSYGRRCLIARRLIERGVRFVQLYIDGQIWDNHNALATGMLAACNRTDLPIAGLLRDLKQRGLLAETLVIWGGEFGRLPIAQLSPDKDEQKSGRDHNKNAACCWLAGGGVKGGVTYGTTDDMGLSAVDNRVSVPDFHATILHQLGLDHTKLTLRSHGIDRRLTDVHGEVIHEIVG